MEAARAEASAAAEGLEAAKAECAALLAAAAAAEAAAENHAGRKKEAEAKAVALKEAAAAAAVQRRKAAARARKDAERAAAAAAERRSAAAEAAQQAANAAVRAQAAVNSRVRAQQKLAEALSRAHASRLAAALAAPATPEQHRGPAAPPPVSPEQAAADALAAARERFGDGSAVTSADLRRVWTEFATFGKRGDSLGERLAVPSSAGTFCPDENHLCARGCWRGVLCLQGGLAGGTFGLLLQVGRGVSRQQAIKQLR